MSPLKPLEIEDRKAISSYVEADPPEISELTFTNLFIWRHRYRPRWVEGAGCLLVVMEDGSGRPFGLPPVGKGDKRAALKRLLEALRQIEGRPRICRASETFVKDYGDSDQFEVVPDRDNSDYVYLTQDLIHLPGRKYHRKKNHLNRFLKSSSFQYRDLSADLVECVLNMQETWCQLRNCAEDPGLLMEDYAINQALVHVEELGFKGGAIVIADKVEAFTLGERLNRDTAVIHIEKANPDIPGIYAAINQLFVQNAFSEMKYINREQDLGLEGLRKAKEAYYPHHMVDKFILTLKGEEG
jgi:hypothetical protein